MPETMARDLVGDLGFLGVAYGAALAGAFLVSSLLKAVARAA